MKKIIIMLAAIAAFALAATAHASSSRKLIQVSRDLTATAPTPTPTPTPTPAPVVAAVISAPVPAAAPASDTHLLTIGQYYLLRYATFKREEDAEKQDAFYQNRPVDQAYIQRLEEACGVNMQYLFLVEYDGNQDKPFTGALDL